EARPFGNLIELGDASGVDGLAGRRRDLDEGHATAAAETVAAEVDEDPAEPGIELRLVAQRTPRAPGALGSVVAGVLGPDPISEEDASSPVCLVERPGHSHAVRSGTVVGTSDDGIRDQGVAAHRRRSPGVGANSCFTLPLTIQTCRIVHAPIVGALS